jgi:hypothetical protein
MVIDGHNITISGSGVVVPQVLGTGVIMLRLHGDYAHFICDVLNYL